MPNDLPKDLPDDLPVTEQRESPPARRAVKVRVTGRVQGVGYRAWAAGEAVALGLFGWVRNRSDGSVEALLKGDAVIVERMLQRMRGGPPFAKVEDVDALEVQGIVPNKFDIKPTV